MLPSFSLYQIYADEILFRDLMLARVMAFMLVGFINLTALMYFKPRTANVVRVILIGGFYGSAVLAFFNFR